MRQWDFIHMVWGVNLDFPAEQKRATINGVDVQFDSVGPIEIRLPNGQPSSQQRSHSVF